MLNGNTYFNAFSVSLFACSVLLKMDLTCFVLHSSSIENSHSVVSSDRSGDKHAYFEKDDKTSWQNSVVTNPVIQAE